MSIVGRVTVALATHSHLDIGPYHQVLLRFSLQNSDELLCCRMFQDEIRCVPHPPFMVGNEQVTDEETEDRQDGKGPQLTQPLTANYSFT